jgi:pyrroline-5-carboxylate reductase
MGLALLRGWQQQGAGGLGSSWCVLALDAAPSEEARSLGATSSPDRQSQDVLVLAIKPQSFDGALPMLRPLVRPNSVVLSVMAGVSIARLQSAFGVDQVIRAMPNTPGAIGEGISAFSTSASVGPAQQAHAWQLLSPLGEVVGPLPEAEIDAVTALSGSGPAYVFALVEAMALAGERAGLSRPIAERLARQTVIGSGALLKEEAQTSPAALRQTVTSPGGTTAAALAVLQAPGGLDALMSEAIAAATARSKALGQAS